MMSEARLLTYGITLGAGLMYLLDPRQGGARRALVRDKSLRALRDVEEAADVGSRDMAHRLEGAVARARGTHRDTAGDDVLVARVRARLGHVCSHPHAVEVKVNPDGAIELKGPVLAHEAREVVRAISHVHGVRSIDDGLERHAHADIALLQGGPVKRPVVARMWTPAARLLIGSGAATLALASLIKASPLGLILSGGTMLALARSSTRGDPQGFLRHRRENKNDVAAARPSREMPGARPRIASAQT